MASIVDSIISKSNNGAFPDIAQQYDAGQKNAIALGGQYLQAKQLEAQIQWHKDEVQNQWQQREDNAYKTLYEQSAQGADSKQIKNVVGAINQIKQMRGSMPLNEDQVNDMVNTYSANPKFGQLAAQYQSMLTESIATGQPLDPSAAKLYQEIRSTPGIAAATRMKEIETSLGTYMTAKGQQLRSNVGVAGKSAQDVINQVFDTHKQLVTNGKDPQAIIGKEANDRLVTLQTSGTPLTDDDKSFVQRVKPALDSAAAGILSEKRNYEEAQKGYQELLDLNKKAIDSDINGTYTKARESILRNAESSLAKGDVGAIRNSVTALSTLASKTSGQKSSVQQGEFNKTQQEKLDDKYLTEVRPIDKDYRKMQSTLNEMKQLINDPKATVRDMNALKIKQAGAIEGITTFGQAAKYKAELGNMLPMTSRAGEAINKAVGSKSSPIPDQTRQDVKSLLDRTQQAIDDQYKGLYKDKLDSYKNLPTYQKSASPGGAIYNDITSKISRVRGIGKQAPTGNTVTLGSGRQVTVDQLKQMIPHMDPEAAKRWTDYINNLGTK